jgi:hypothetical protein
MKWRAWMTCVLALCWWGVLYPELCFPEETYQTVAEDGGDSDTETSAEDILQATKNDTVVRSRFLEWIDECLKK